MYIWFKAAEVLP